MRTGNRIRKELERARIKTCHRIPERSFVVDGVQSTFCQRCTGIYLGFLISSLFILFTSGLHINSVDISILVLAIPMLYDGFSQAFGKRHSNNVFRFTTGLMFSFAMTPVLFLAQDGFVFSSINYLIFVLISIVSLMLIHRRFSENSVFFVKTVSSLSIISILLGFIILPLFVVRTSILGFDLLYSFLVQFF